MIARWFSVDTFSLVFPESFCWRVLALLCGVAFAQCGASGASPAHRRRLDFSLRKLGQKIEMCVSRDVVISKLARTEQNELWHESRKLQVVQETSCFTVFPYESVYRLLPCVFFMCVMCSCHVNPSCLKHQIIGVKVSSFLHLVYAERYFIS